MSTGAVVFQLVSLEPHGAPRVPAGGDDVHPRSAGRPDQSLIKAAPVAQLLLLVLHIQLVGTVLPTSCMCM